MHKWCEHCGWDAVVAQEQGVSDCPRPTGVDVQCDNMRCDVAAVTGGRAAWLRTLAHLRRLT